MCVESLKAKLEFKTQYNMKNHMIKMGIEWLNCAVCDFMMWIAFIMNDTIVFQLE